MTSAATGLLTTGGRHAVRVSAVIVAGEEILLVRRSSGEWELPGGLLPVGMSIPAAVRELVAGDTRAIVAVNGVTGIYPRNTPRLGITCRATHVGGAIAPVAPHAIAATWLSLSNIDGYLPGPIIDQVHDALLPQKMWPELPDPPGSSIPPQPDRRT